MVVAVAMKLASDCIREKMHPFLLLLVDLSSLTAAVWLVVALQQTPPAPASLFESPTSRRSAPYQWW